MTEKERESRRRRRHRRASLTVALCLSRIAHSAKNVSSGSNKSVLLEMQRSNNGRSDCSRPKQPHLNCSARCNNRKQR